MKVLFIHNTIPEYRVEFMKLLSKKIDVDFLITNQELGNKIYSLQMDQSFDQLRIEYLPSKQHHFINLRNKINQGMYDVIILPPADNVKQYFEGVFALLYGKRQKAKLIYWTEKWEAKKENQPVKKRIKNFCHRLMIGSLARRVDHCIAAGSKSKGYFIKCRVPGDRITIAYDSSTSTISKHKFDIWEKYKIPKEEKIILYLGRMVERKGCKILIQAFEQLENEHTNYTLLIGGDGDCLQACESYVSEHKIQKVIFAGKVDPKLRSLYYKAADVFVLPSYSAQGTIEAWGLTVNESLEIGTPVVATTAVGSAWDLLNEKNGIMVQENSVTELAKGIENILESHHDYESACKETAKQFDVNHMAESFEMVLRNQMK